MSDLLFQNKLWNNFLLFPIVRTRKKEGNPMKTGQNVFFLKFPLGVLTWNNEKYMYVLVPRALQNQGNLLTQGI